jgi:peptidoglycan/LPS O-acetylase OafA/YrhL
LAQLYLAATVGAMMAFLRLAPAMRFGPLAWIGRISYSLYLVHQSVGVTIIALLMARGWTQEPAIAAVCVICVTLAWLMFSFVELPGQRLVMVLYGRLRDRKPAAAPGLMTSGPESQSWIS